MTKNGEKKKRINAKFSRVGTVVHKKLEPREVRDEQSSGQHVPRRVFGKTTFQEHAVVVTTREALDGSREKRIRIEC